MMLVFLFLATLVPIHKASDHSHYTLQPKSLEPIITTPRFNIGTLPSLSDVVNQGLVRDRYRVHQREAEEIWSFRNTGPETATIQADQEAHKFYFQTDGETLYFTGPKLTISGPKSERYPGLVMRLEGDVHNQIDTPYTKRPLMKNIALGHYASADASSALCGHYPQNAVDGNTDGHDNLNYVAMTGRHGKDPQPYWQVDLGKAGEASLTKVIRVWNREDGGKEFQSRIVPFWVMGFSSFEGVDAHGLPMGPPRRLEHALNQALVKKRFDTVERMYEWILNVGVHLRWVRIQMEKTNFLQLAEVQVFAVEPFHVCPDLPESSDIDIDPLCYKVSSRTVQPAPTSIAIKYSCLLPGVYTIRADIPWYSSSSSSSTTTTTSFAWRKLCTDKKHSFVHVNLVPWTERHHESQQTGWESRGVAWVPGQLAVVEPVATQNSEGALPELESETNSEFNFQNPSHVVPGHVDESLFSMWLDAVDEVQKIRSPILKIESTTSSDDDDDDDDDVVLPVATPKFVGPLSKGGNLNSNRQLLRLQWQCIREGWITARITITLMPYLQPYDALRFSIVKRCGGPRRAGLNVNIEELGHDDWVLIRDGALVASPALRDHVFDGIEQMVMSVKLPLAESLVEVPTDFEHNYDQLSVDARCEPGICKERYVHDRPRVRVKQNQTKGNGPEDGMILIDHYCSSNQVTDVSVLFQIGFYDRISFTYRARCGKPWYVNLIPWLW